MNPLHFEARDRYALTPAQLWTFVADTQRLNRSIGLPTARFTHEPRADGGSLVTGAYRLGWITLARWREHAFDFVRPLRYSVLREYEAGPFVRVYGGAELTPTDGGAELRVYADITPRHVVGWLAARLMVGPQSTKRVLARCREYERHVLGEMATSGAAPLEVAATEVYIGAAPQVDQTRLDQLARRLVEAGGDPEVAGRLKEHLATASDDRVAGMRPFELADLWGADRHTTLAAFLRATTVGLLDMRWDVLCPYCRVPKAEYASLSDLAGQAHCEHCNIVFDSTIDRLVEVRFKPSPSIREAAVGLYCIGGPQNTPHVVAQTELEPGQAIEWQIPVEAKAYRLRSPQSGRAGLVEVLAGGTGQVSLALEREGVAPGIVQVGGEHLALRVESRLGAPAVVALEEQQWPDTAATAAVVSTMQEFRDLFSSEVLAPGIEVAIERIGVLFTDLAGSTALYERIGQAHAFRLVQDHFRVLEEAIREHQGALIKTIGDAVMAVFPSAARAVGAGFAMQGRMGDLSDAEGFDTSALLKVGIHAGSCLVVTLNDRLDYFGTTVNIAARANHEAQGGEIVLTADAYADGGVAELVQESAQRVETCQAVLKGITEPVQLYRVTAVGG